MIHISRKSSKQWEKRQRKQNVHQRQDRYSVKQPPTIGPSARPNWPSPMLRPMNFACACTGKMAARMVIAPFPMPEEPAPAMARPTISIADDCAAPHSKEPNRKTKKNTRKVH